MPDLTEIEKLEKNIERLRRELYQIAQSNDGYKLSEEIINKSKELDRLISKYQRMDIKSY